jgi:hypothetical protein
MCFSHDHTGLGFSRNVTVASAFCPLLLSTGHLSTSTADGVRVPSPVLTVFASFLQWKIGLFPFVLSLEVS